MLYNNSNLIFPGATSKQLLDYLDVGLDINKATVLVHVSTNNIFNLYSKSRKVLLKPKSMVNKSRNFRVKYIFVSSLVYTKRNKIELLEKIHKKLVSLCKALQVHVLGNRNI